MIFVFSERILMDFSLFLSGCNGSRVLDDNKAPTMDFGTMRDKIAANGYQSVTEFKVEHPRTWPASTSQSQAQAEPAPLLEPSPGSSVCVHAQLPSCGLGCWQSRALWVF